MLTVLQVIAEMGSGGAEAVVEELALGLRRHDVEVVVASAGGRRLPVLQEAGIRTPHVPLVRRSVAGGMRAASALRDVRRRERPDVVHAHNVAATLSAHLGVRALRRRPPLLTTFHGVAEQDYPRAAAVLRRCADHVVAVHEEVADTLRRAGLRGVPLTVVPNAVSAPPAADRAAARAALGLGADRTVALCAARLVPQKRHDVLVDAWSRIPGDPVLLLAGAGELQEAITDDVRRRGLADRVLVLGERPDVPALLAAADAFVLSSDWEGLPIALLEALAAGLPVVATEVDGVREAAGARAARLVPRRDPAALAEALSAVLGDPTLRAGMSRAARERAAERGSASSMVEAYAAVYASLRDGARRSRTVAP